MLRQSINNDQTPLLQETTASKTVRQITSHVFSYIAPMFVNRLIQMAQAGVLIHVVVRLSAESGAANTFIMPLNTIFRTSARMSASYFTPAKLNIKDDNKPGASQIFQQAIIIQMMNAGASISIITLFLTAYREVGHQKIFDPLFDYYKITLCDIPIFAMHSLMNNVLIAKESKNLIPVFGFLALGINIGSFVYLNQRKALSMTSIAAVILMTDVIILALQLIVMITFKKLGWLFKKNGRAPLAHGFGTILKETGSMSLQAIGEILMGVADALLVGRLDLVQQNLWSVVNSFIFLFYSFGVDIGRALANSLSKIETKREKNIAYWFCKALGLGVTGVSTAIFFSPLQEKTVKLFLAPELWVSYEEHRPEINSLLMLTSAVLFVELQATIAKNFVRGLDSKDTPWIFKVTMGALYALELPLMLMAAFCFHGKFSNLFTFLALWLVGATTLEVALELRPFKLLNPTCWASLFGPPPSLEEIPPALLSPAAQLYTSRT